MLCACVQVDQYNCLTSYVLEKCFREIISDKQLDHLQQSYNFVTLFYLFALLTCWSQILKLLFLWCKINYRPMIWQFVYVSKKNTHCSEGYASTSAISTGVLKLSFKPW